MKESLKAIACMSVLILGWSFTGTAQPAQTTTNVTLHLKGLTYTTDYPVNTNQIVSLVGYDSADSPTIYCTFPDETIAELYNSDSYEYPNLSAITGLTSITISNSAYGFDGVNEYLKPGYGWATFSITTPQSAMVVSNYVPADAIVIPANGTGSAQIILESSPDLVNWTAASPGIYSASDGTNRFFRVRAAATP